jgi:hypothetical protein
MMWSSLSPRWTDCGLRVRPRPHGLCLITGEVASLRTGRGHSIITPPEGGRNRSVSALLAHHTRPISFTAGRIRCNMTRNIGSALLGASGQTLRPSSGVFPESFPRGRSRYASPLVDGCAVACFAHIYWKSVRSLSRCDSDVVTGCKARLAGEVRCPLRQASRSNQSRQ